MKRIWVLYQAILPSYPQCPWFRILLWYRSYLGLDFCYPRRPSFAFQMPLWILFVIRARDLSNFTCWRQKDKTQGVLNSSILSLVTKKGWFQLFFWKIKDFKNIGFLRNKLWNQLKLTDKNRPNILAVNPVILQSDRRFFQHFRILLRFRATDFRFIMIHDDDDRQIIIGIRMGLSNESSDSNFCGLFRMSNFVTYFHWFHINFE